MITALRSRIGICAPTRINDGRVRPTSCIALNAQRMPTVPAERGEIHLQTSWSKRRDGRVEERKVSPNLYTHARCKIPSFCVGKSYSFYSF
jgi:hypothetical protein